MRTLCLLFVAFLFRPVSNTKTLRAKTQSTQRGRLQFTTLSLPHPAKQKAGRSSPGLLSIVVQQILPDPFFADDQIVLNREHTRNSVCGDVRQIIIAAISDIAFQVYPSVLNYNPDRRPDLGQVVAESMLRQRREAPVGVSHYPMVTARAPRSDSLPAQHPEYPRPSFPPRS